MAKNKNKQTFSETLRNSKRGFLIITLIFVALLCFYPGNNIFLWLSAKRGISVQERKIARYKKEIREMDSKIKELSLEKDSLEQFAREEFHFSEPGEDVYLIDE